MAGKNPLLCAEFLHVSYVTDEYDRAVDTLKERCGVARYADFGTVTLQNEANEDLTIRLGIGYIGPSYVELIEPLSGPVDIYREALRSKRPESPMVWHHVAMSVPTLADMRGIKAAFREWNVPIAIANPRGDFMYADTRVLAGHYTEYVVMDEATRELHRSLRDG